jgi:hypothetical protein
LNINQPITPFFFPQPQPQPAFLGISLMILLTI